MSELKIPKKKVPKHIALVNELLGTDEWKYVEVITESMLIDIVMEPHCLYEDLIKDMGVSRVPHVGAILTFEECCLAAVRESDRVGRAVSLIDKFFNADKKAYKVWNCFDQWMLCPDLIQQALEAKARTEAYMDAWYKVQISYNPGCEIPEAEYQKHKRVVDAYDARRAQVWGSVGV